LLRCRLVTGSNREQHGHAKSHGQNVALTTRAR
jgi:hypothetical protein